LTFNRKKHNNGAGLMKNYPNTSSQFFDHPVAEPFDPRSLPILLVDDEEVALELFKDNFGDDFTVFTAGSGSAALEVLQENPIALILCDQRMPGMLGTEFFAEVRKLYPNVIRILVTAFADLKALVSAINAGQIYQYVEKPWDEDELKIILRRGLEHFHLRDERESLQKEKVETLEKLARNNRLAAVGTLAAGIAHEIRNPLSAILTFHQMLDEKLEDARADAATLSDDFWTTFAKIPLREVERIRRLVQELLDFSRDSVSRYELKPLCLKKTIEHVVRLVDTDARRQGVHVKTNLPDEAYFVFADSDKIKQVLINLIINSILACSAGGVVEVSVPFWELNGEHGFEIVVADNGCGMPAETLEKVFDPFFTTREVGVGTGLGLTICHYIMTHHGGEILITSETGKGTQVKLRFPSLNKSQAAQNGLVSTELLPPQPIEATPQP